MKILNLYAGIGGNRKLWDNEHEITAVEYDKDIAAVYKNYFPSDNVIIADAHQYLLDHYKEFDFIWASPPCPTHSRLNFTNNAIGNKIEYPNMTLYQEIIFLKQWFNGKFCIENVIPYYKPLIPANAELHRHLFWTNFYIKSLNINDDRKHNDVFGHSTVYGFNIRDTDIGDKRKSLRNMVNPEIAKYILDCAMQDSEKQLNMRI